LNATEFVRGIIDVTTLPLLNLSSIWTKRCLMMHSHTCYTGIGWAGWTRDSYC